MSDVLEQQLARLAERIDVEVGDRLANGVLARVGEQTTEPDRSQRSPWRPVWIAAAAVIVVVVGMLVLPGPRHAVANWFGLGSTRIERAPTTTVATSSPATVSSPSVESPNPATTQRPTTQQPTTSSSVAEFPAELSLGRATTATDAAARTSLPVPVSPELGEPLGIFVVRPPDAGQVIVLYPASATLPATAVGGVGGLLSAVSGRLDQGGFLKVAATGTVVENVQVTTASGDTVAGVWLEGEPHQYMFEATNGEFEWDTLRLATNTLLWEQDGVVYRLESDLARDQALRAASTVIAST